MMRYAVVKDDGTSYIVGAASEADAIEKCLGLNDGAEVEDYLNVELPAILLNLNLADTVAVREAIEATGYCTASSWLGAQLIAADWKETDMDGVYHG